MRSLDDQSNAAAPPVTSIASPRGERMAALDGLRGVAILWVLLHQLVVIEPSSSLELALLWPLQLGWVGVTLFFVLSGYLITGVLLDTRDAPHRVSSFYARRSLRVLPLYWLLLTGVWAMSLGSSSSSEVAQLSAPQTASFWLLLGNWAQAEAGSYLVGPLAPTWSVAIEEQFYLVWPLVVWSVRDLGALSRVCIAVVGLSCATRLAGCYWWEWDAVALYVLTPTRLDALALGALAAVAVRSGFAPMAHRGWLVASLALCGAGAAAGDLAAALAAGPGGPVVTDWSLGPGMTLGALAATALVLLLIDAGGAPGLRRIFEARWLRSFGKYSYGIYLTHGPVRAAVRDLLYGPARNESGGPLVSFPEVGGSMLPALALYITLCVPLCWLVGRVSYYVVERPFLRMKGRFRAE